MEFEEENNFGCVPADWAGDDPYDGDFAGSCLRNAAAFDDMYAGWISEQLGGRVSILPACEVSAILSLLRSDRPGYCGFVDDAVEHDFRVLEDGLGFDVYLRLIVSSGTPLEVGRTIGTPVLAHVGADDIVEHNDANAKVCLIGLGAYDPVVVVYRCEPSEKNPYGPVISKIYVLNGVCEDVGRVYKSPFVKQSTVCDLICTTDPSDITAKMLDSVTHSALLSRAIYTHADGVLVRCLVKLMRKGDRALQWVIRDHQFKEGATYDLIMGLADRETQNVILTVASVASMIRWDYSPRDVGLLVGSVMAEGKNLDSRAADAYSEYWFSRCLGIQFRVNPSESVRAVLERFARQFNRTYGIFAVHIAEMIESDTIAKTVRFPRRVWRDEIISYL